MKSVNWGEGSLGKIGLHSVGGGIVGEINGGSFRDGAIGGAFSQAFMPITPAFGNYGIMASTMVGGIASKLGGGEFIVGAMSAFIAYQYNHNYHDPRLNRAYGSPVDKLKVTENAATLTGGLDSMLMMAPAGWSKIAGMSLLGMSAFSTFNKHLLLMELGQFNGNNAFIDVVTTVTSYPKNPVIDFVYDQTITNISGVVNK